jgi:hypothetical protein
MFSLEVFLAFKTLVRLVFRYSRVFNETDQAFSLMNCYYFS